ncbi:MAG: hypothetical protein CML16_03140 [Pusillimonas sp.]|nr:hypothetical protein [Pusillimonas sp.]MBC43582.1 hypothetical protein [Pusillimonas sp.]HCP78965.1 hypothetical protein [Pusillimonas sp.]|tara:strand:- start:660 stop:998 length:339 start_codon:yes stop_codon:yes gene_type:complete
MSKQSRLEAKQRMIALGYAFETRSAVLVPASAEQIVGAAEKYLKFLQGGKADVSGSGNSCFKFTGVDPTARDGDIMNSYSFRPAAHTNPNNPWKPDPRDSRIPIGPSDTVQN